MSVKTLIGLTGGIGCGKSAALIAFSRLSCATIDADKICYDLYEEPEGVVVSSIKKRWGSRVLTKSIIDKQKIAQIDHYAQNLGIKTLWAGGITIDQAYEFGKLGVFGIYVTSAASVSRPVSSAYAGDPMLASEKEPTYKGVSRTKLLLEAGFLMSSHNKEGKKRIAEEIEKKSENLIRSLRKARTIASLDTESEGLHSLLQYAWKKHFEMFS